MLFSSSFLCIYYKSTLTAQQWPALGRRVWHENRNIHFHNYCVQYCINVIALPLSGNLSACKDDVTIPLQSFFLVFFPHHAQDMRRAQTSYLSFAWEGSVPGFSGKLWCDPDGRFVTWERTRTPGKRNGAELSDLWALKQKRYISLTVSKTLWFNRPNWRTGVCNVKRGIISVLFCTVHHINYAVNQQISLGPCWFSLISGRIMNSQKLYAL